MPRGNDKCQDSSELKSSRVPDGKCGRCGKSHTLNGQCPANDQDCRRKCGRKGHFAKLCWSKDNTNKRNFKAGRIRTRACQTKPDIRLPVMTEVQSCTTTIVWKDDTGSDVDVIGPKHMENLSLTTDMLSPVTETVTAADERTMPARGCIPATLQLPTESIQTTLYVIDGVEEALLSKNSLTKLGFLPENWPLHSESPIRVQTMHSSDSKINSDKMQLVTEFSDVFDESRLKVMNTAEMEIPLVDDAIPFQAATARANPFAYREQAKQQLNDMENKDIIEKVRAVALVSPNRDSRQKRNKRKTFHSGFETPEFTGETYCSPKQITQGGSE